jgi:hypothetical protein
MTTLFILSALLLGAWFAVLHSLWKGPPPVALEDPPNRIETLVQRKLSEVTGQNTAAESSPQRRAHLIRESSVR